MAGVDYRIFEGAPNNKTAIVMPYAGEAHPDVLQGMVRRTGAMVLGIQTPNGTGNTTVNVGAEQMAEVVPIQTKGYDNVIALGCSPVRAAMLGKATEKVSGMFSHAAVLARMPAIKELRNDWRQLATDTAKGALFALIQKGGQPDWIVKHFMMELSLARSADDKRPPVFALLLPRTSYSEQRPALGMITNIVKRVLAQGG